ncbi:response regulator transcription factor [Bacillaceae bacterium Marseille-Q3522]|nr:response regulator transcription factor [Bacillaceae bacterium Marseille-Q3522]
MTKILIVDDHPAVGEGTKALIEQDSAMEAVVLTDGKKINERILKNFDLFLIDLMMPNISGIQLTKTIIKSKPDAIVLIYSGYDLSPYFNLLMEAGASGFLSKTSSREELIAAIRFALREKAVISVSLLKQLRKVKITGAESDLRELTLSDIEKNILIEVSNGLTNAKIAEKLYMSQRNVEHHLSKLFERLEVGSRVEVIKVAKEKGLIL